jgi:phosphoenolpyruvate synthase/pyruvate phosphate dikinase
MPVSPGAVSGPVTILHTPHEKPVAEGDVLVAYTTDPGWTPLFVNAAAVVIEWAASYSTAPSWPASTASPVWSGSTAW